MTTVCPFATVLNTSSVLLLSVRGTITKGPTPPLTAKGGSARVAVARTSALVPGTPPKATKSVASAAADHLRRFGHDPPTDSLSLRSMDLLLSSTLAICRRKPLQNKDLTLRARFR